VKGGVTVSCRRGFFGASWRQRCASRAPPVRAISGHFGPFRSCDWPQDWPQRERSSDAAARGRRRHGRLLPRGRLSTLGADDGQVRRPQFEDRPHPALLAAATRANEVFPPSRHSRAPTLSRLIPLAPLPFLREPLNGRQLEGPYRESYPLHDEGRRPAPAKRKGVRNADPSRQGVPFRLSDEPIAAAVSCPRGASSLQRIPAATSGAKDKDPF